MMLKKGDVITIKKIKRWTKDPKAWGGNLPENEVMEIVVEKDGKAYTIKGGSGTGNAPWFDSEIDNGIMVEEAGAPKKPLPPRRALRGIKFKETPENVTLIFSGAGGSGGNKEV